MSICTPLKTFDFNHPVCKNYQFGQSYNGLLLKNPSSKLESYVINNDALMADHQASTKRLFCLDYDGTLSAHNSFLNSPNQRLIDTLTSLTNNPQNFVYVISGRDRKSLQSYLGHIPKLGLSSEYGCLLKRHDSQEWKLHKECLHRHKEYADLPMLSTDETQKTANKGAIVEHLIKFYEPDFVFAAGDNRRDEPMFAAIDKMAKGKNYTVKVGSRRYKSLAKSRVKSPQELLHKLNHLSALYKE